MNIIATIGPATSSVKKMEQLLEAGVTCFRLNFSHGTHKSHKETINKMKQAMENSGINAELLIDTKGAEVRTHKFNWGKATFKEGDEVTVSTTEILGTNKKFSVNYHNFARTLNEGDVFLIDDGLLKFKVISTKAKELVAVALNSHTVKDNRGVNVPGIRLSLPYISVQDKKDILFAVENGATAVAISFVSSREEICIVKDMVPKGIKMIAKIESQDGVNNFNEILKIADGIMIARGDLGVEVGLAKVPAIQKEFIPKAVKAKKIAIVATQTLTSMTKSAIPTRAEISDIYNSVLDGANALMLSEETATGKYPIEVINVMQDVIKEAELCKK